MRGYSPGKSMVGVAGFEPTTSSSRNLGSRVSRGQMRRIAVLRRRLRVALVVLVAVLLCCTSRSRRRCAAAPLLSGPARHAEGGWRCPPTSIPGRAGQRQRSVSRGRCRRATAPRWLVAVASRPYIRVSRRRAEVPVRLVVGGVSDTRTISPTRDWPSLVRSMSEGALVAPVADGVVTPDRQPVPVTQFDLYGRRPVRRLP
jgi:hypothetical protein